MKVFVTGVGGQLGYDVVHRLRSREIECVGTDILDAWVDTIEKETGRKRHISLCERRGSHDGYNSVLWYENRRFFKD